MTQTELSSAGYELDDAEYALLGRFVDALLAENARVNLTGTREPRALWGQHICDSLALLRPLEEARPQSLLDVGTGGGLPGIAIACVCPGLRVTLLDATRKKLDALDRIIRELALDDVKTLWGRAETLAHDAAYRESFDAVTVRAVGDLRVCIEYAAGFIRPGGQAWFYRGTQSVEADVARGERAAGRCRMSHVSTWLYDLPAPHGTRALAVYVKDNPLPTSLPRAAGTPKLKPL